MRAERDRTEWAVTAQAITEEHYMKGYCVSKTLQLYGTEPVNSQWTLLFCCTRDCSMSARNLTGTRPLYYVCRADSVNKAKVLCFSAV